jgi:choline dehydrogenase-like flavoprotein
MPVSLLEPNDAGGFTFTPIPLHRQWREASEKCYGKVGIGEALFNASSTAHILGGCCRGPTSDKGVVGMNGEVFGYPNLFVADGPVVPANLGVNPSLTITALSEYIMSQRPAK